ncbi:MAG: patatin-like phospholipase family protein [Mycobacteriales bacterium]
MTVRTTMRFALVLGAGGTAGEAFHRGVLRALPEVGLDPRSAAVVVGTSAGSIVAASIRRQPVAGPAEPVGERPRPGRLRDRAGALATIRRPRQALNALLLGPDFVNGRTSAQFIAEALRDSHGQSWPRAALWIVAVRRGDGHRVVFGRSGEPVTDVGSAVAASCAIPAYFSPVEIDGTAYVDGGVHSPTNADLLSSCDLDLVVISSPMSVRPTALRGPRADLPLRLLFHRYLRAEVWALRRRGDAVVTIEPDAAALNLMGLNMMNGQRIVDIERRAYELARRELSRLRSTPGPATAAGPAS